MKVISNNRKKGTVRIELKEIEVQSLLHGTIPAEMKQKLAKTENPKPVALVEVAGIFSQFHS